MSIKDLADLEKQSQDALLEEEKEEKVIVEISLELSAKQRETLRKSLGALDIDLSTYIKQLLKQKGMI